MYFILFPSVYDSSKNGCEYNTVIQMKLNFYSRYLDYITKMFLIIITPVQISDLMASISLISTSADIDYFPKHYELC